MGKGAYVHEPDEHSRELPTVAWLRQEGGDLCVFISSLLWVAGGGSGTWAQGLCAAQLCREHCLGRQVLGDVAPLLSWSQAAIQMQVKSVRFSFAKHL